MLESMSRPVTKKVRARQHGGRVVQHPGRATGTGYFKQALRDYSRYLEQEYPKTADAKMTAAAQFCLFLLGTPVRGGRLPTGWRKEDLED